MKGKNALLALVVVGLVIVGILYIAGRNKPPIEPGGNAQVSVRMKWFFAGTMTGWFAGVEQGIFEKHGIDLTITPGGPDNSSVKLVAAGSDMFGVAGADEVLLARAKGVPIVAIGVLFKESPLCFIAKKERGITKPSDWAGKTVEVSFGSNAEVQFRALVAKYGVRNIREVPYTFNLVPFIEGKVDASVAYVMDQVVTLERQGIELDIITAKEHGINPYGDVIITTETMLHEKPELVMSFMAAVVEAQQWAIANPDEAVHALVSAAGNLQPANEQAVWAATIPFLTVDGGVDAVGVMADQRWQETFDVMVKYGGLTPDLNLTAAYRDMVE